MRKLPERWASAALSDVTQVIMGQSPPSSAYNDVGTGLPFLQGKAEFGALRPEPVKWCTDAKKVAEADDILLSVRAPVGPTNLSLARCCIGRGLAALRPLRGLENRFLLYQIRAREHELVRLGHGVTFRAIRKKELTSWPTFVAPLREQNRIVAKIESLFARLDEGVAALRRAETNLERYRASVLKAAVEGRFTERWRRENPPEETGEELLQRILAERRNRWQNEQLSKFEAAARKPPKNWKRKYQEPVEPYTSELPELPKGWCWATLPQLGDFGRGKSKHRPRGDAVLYGGDFPFIQTSEVKRASGWIRHHSKTYNHLGLSQSRLWPKETLCITIAANIAETGILAYPACFPDSIVGLFIGRPTLTKFVDYFIQTVKSDLARYAPATAQKNINLTTLSGLVVPLPPAAEQERIVELAERLLTVQQAAEAIVNARARAAERLRDSILKQAFQGRLVRQDPNDEPASVLLERIRAGREAESKGGKRRPSKPIRQRKGQVA